MARYPEGAALQSAGSLCQAAWSRRCGRRRGSAGAALLSGAAGAFSEVRGGAEPGWQPWQQRAGQEFTWHQGHPPWGRHLGR